MENKRKLLRCIFISCIGLVVVFFLLVSFDNKLNSLNGSSQPVMVLPQSKLKQWEDPGPYHVAYPRNYRFIMDDTPTCRNRTPFLVLMVPVAPSDVQARDTIRKTWGGEKSVLGRTVETLFILGLPGGADHEQQQEKLHQENLQHHDLIQSGFQDSYHNLTIKTMLTLKWLSHYCANASYFMKTDSDMFLHVPNLVKLLLDPKTLKQNYMSGLVWWHSPVLRDPFNKFYMPAHVFAEPEYPPYPLGMAYVMSLDLPAKLLRVSSQIKPIYIEDAYLGICLKRLGLAPTDPPEDTMFLVLPKHPLSNCSLSKVIAVTTESRQQMMSYWKKSKQLNAEVCQSVLSGVYNMFTMLL